METIRNGDVVIIQRFNYMRTHKLNVAKNVQLGRDVINVSSIEGKPYGTAFEMKPDPSNKKVFILEEVDELPDFEEQFLRPGESGDDNRNINDSNVAQKLSKEDIEKLREEGTAGHEIVGQLIENSESFQQKTKFSQAKFLKKKAKKYYHFVVIRRPTVRLLMQIHYKNDPMKILNLRIDSLAQLLNQVNVRSGGRFMVYETGCQGLVVAAALERIGSRGKLVHVFQTGNPQTQSLNAMNFSEEVLGNLTTLNMYHLRALEEGEDLTVMHKNGENGDKDEKQKEDAMETGDKDDENRDDGKQDKVQKVPFRQHLREQSIASHALLKTKTMDGLIIAAKQDPTNILLTLTEYLAPSRPFAVFSPYKEPLMEAYVALKDKGKAVMVMLSETWLRNYQVLPDRTHPEVLMSGGGGYVLSGIVVDPSEEHFVEGEEGVAQPSGRKNKRFRRR